MARTYNDIYYNDDENSTAEILDDMKKLAESVDQQIGSIKSFNNDTSQFIEQVTPLMNTLSEQVIDMHQLADTMFTELEQVKEENKQLRQDLNGLPERPASGESIDLNDSAEMRCELKISGNSVQDGEPTPDEPVEVECCGDNINLFDKDNASVLKGYISGSTNTTAFVTTDNSNKCIYIPCKPNKAYTVSKVSSERFRIATTQTIASEVDINKTNNDIATKLTIISRKDDKYLIVYYYCKDYDTLTEQEILNSIKIVEGTETGEYSPYGQGCINEVICNKNLVNVDVEQGAIGGNEGIDYASTKANNNTRIRTKDLIKLDTSKTYTINFNKKYNVVIQAFNSNKLLYSSTDGIANVWHTNSFNFSGYPYVAVAIRNNDNTSNITPSEIEKVKLSLSETDKTQTYTIPTQQPFRAIGDIRDTFIKKNNKWYEHHPVIRKIFDGTEHWKKSSTYSGGFYINWSEFDRSGKHFSEFYCNYAKYVSTLAEYGNNIGVCFSDAACSIRTTDGSNINTVELWKAYLQAQYNAGTPVYVDYVLEEPQDIECTEEQSTILDQIENEAKTYKNVTHIYSTDEISPVIDVTYKKDIETLFANTLVEGV